MAMGGLQVALIEARLGDLPKENATAVRQVLYRACMGVKLGSSAAPNGEEARASFIAWEEMGPQLAYARVAMRDLLRDLNSHTPPRAGMVRAYRLHYYKAVCQSNYLFYLEDNVTLAVANAADLGVGLGVVCTDVVESLNAILKRAYNDHTSRGGGGTEGNGITTGGGGGLAGLRLVVF